ncbi:MAG: metalloregulator ArsR/SmtB family transcription factor [Hyphomicrobiales bacterium]|jgi:DNA-binding transcriptional ArsR family regulator|nr:metalloregulator ArsR/SmtB family transcription factor [Hyphomicrobiales bacterium]
METEQAVLALAALAQSTRMEAFRTLVKHEPEGVPAGELARAVGVPQNTLSAHLAILSRAGLVVGERNSRSIIYRANLAAFQELTLFMVHDCCGGNTELCAPLIQSLKPRRAAASKSASQKSKSTVGDRS